MGLSRTHRRPSSSSRPLALAGDVSSCRGLFNRREAVVTVDGGRLGLGRRRGRVELGQGRGDGHRCGRRSGSGRLGRFGLLASGDKVETLSLSSSKGGRGRRGGRAGRGRSLPGALGRGRRKGTTSLSSGEGLVLSLLLQTDLLQVSRTLSLTLLSSGSLGLLLGLALSGLDLSTNLSLLGGAGVVLGLSSCEREKCK